MPKKSSTTSNPSDQDIATADAPPPAAAATNPATVTTNGAEPAPTRAKRAPAPRKRKTASAGRDPAIEAQIDQFAALYPFALDEFQREAIRLFLSDESVMVAAPTGSGKALANGTRVLTPTGWRAIERLRVGDRVIGGDGQPTPVIGVFPQGERPAFRVAFNDGIQVVCDLDHLWAVNTKSRRHGGLPWRVLTLRQILKEGLADGIGHRHFVPMVGPVAFQPPPAPSIRVKSLAVARARTGLTQRQLASRLGVTQGMVATRELGRRAITKEWRDAVVHVVEDVGPRPPLDPYLLGALLGDGGFSTPTLRFSSADHQIIESLRRLLPSGTTLVRASTGVCDWHIVSESTGLRNPAIGMLRDLGLWGHRAERKFIPRSYKFALVEDRLAVLQGLLDSDGSVDRDGYIEYLTVSPRLAADVAFLVRSLGGRTRIRTKKTTGQLAYRLHISLPPEIVPFRLLRKRERYGARVRRAPTRAITSVEPVGSRDMTCIAVAAPDGLFVVDGFVVTHNTVVAELGVYQAFARTGRVLYTTPIKALSNQKYRDLRAIYGDQVGLLTGDVSENREARVVVMTTEVLRNMLLQTPWDLDDVGCVIFDEIHYLADPERGTTWEEAIILCPEHIQLVCLSATVSNAAEIAAWIGRTHRPIRLVTYDQRPVPLALYYFYDDKLQPVVDHTGALIKEFRGVGGELRRQSGRPRNGRYGGLGQRDTPDLEEPQPREIVDALAADEMLPAIYFLFSRNDCQAYAERLAVMRPNLIKPGHLERINAVIAGLLAGLRPEDRELEQVRLITALAQKGIGFHHAGLLPILKQVVEVLFGRGLMQVVFATDTLALGVNMPARTVVIGRMSKWDGRRRRMLIPNEFQQMSGRAGRRGMDAFGHVVVPYSPWFTFKEVLDIATGQLEPVRSAFAVRYNTVLNLWDPPRGDRVRHMLQQSLAQFQSSQRIRLIEDDVVEVGGDIAAVPHGCLIGYDDGDDLLEEYRGLIRSLTAAQHKEKRLREELTEAQREVTSGTPWPEPGRQALRRVFRTALPGLVVHCPSWGWGIYLGHGGQGGVGRFLFGEEIRLLSQYKQIDYLPDEKHVGLPEELIEPPDDITDAKELISAAKLKSIGRKLEKLDLPDLAQLAAEYRQRERERFGGTLEDADRGLAEATRQVTILFATRDAHPCHTCPVRKQHRDNLTRIDKLEQERNALQALLERETDAEEARIRGVIRGIRDVLHRFGYLHRGYPTAKADMLADVFDNDGLILCELVERGWLDRLAPDDLAEVFSWFCFDREFRYTNHFTLPQQLVLLRRRLEDLERDVIGEERDHGLVISEGHNQAFYGAARAWCRGASMADINDAIELSEGDLVLTMNKTIDLMRQIREMLLDVQPDHTLVMALIEAERLLRRGIVEQSLTIGFAPAPVNDPGADEAESPDSQPALAAVDSEAEVEGMPAPGDAADGAMLMEPKRARRARKKVPVAAET